MGCWATEGGIKGFHGLGEQHARPAQHAGLQRVVAGQGAGVAAAQSLHDGRELDEVSIGSVQRVLEAQGVRIH